MSQPNYQLRANKAIDRLIFMDAIRRLDHLEHLDEYTYYSLGGPYLEDCRALYEVNQAIRMTSIDTNPEVIKRQRFHLPCSHLKLIRSDMSAFITQYDAKDKKSIFWLDYTRLAYSDLDDFRALLTRVAINSIIKITVRAQYTDYAKSGKSEEFKREFGILLPDPGAGPPIGHKKFATLVMQMVRIAAQRALSGANSVTYQPLCSFYYSDSTQMVTVTGIVCSRAERVKVRSTFGDWMLASFNWAAPKRIAVPALLTTKERLLLQKWLPAKKNPGGTLRRALGYGLDEDRPRNNELLKQYAQFHRYSPYIMRGIP